MLLPVLPLLLQRGPGETGSSWHGFSTTRSTYCTAAASSLQLRYARLHLLSPHALTLSHTHTHAHAHTRTHTYTHTLTHTQTHSHTDTHRHTHTHTQTHTM